MIKRLMLRAEILDREVMMICADGVIAYHGDLDVQPEQVASTAGLP